MDQIYLGWDVGAWNSERGDSRDALFCLVGKSLERLSPGGVADGYRPRPSSPFRDDLENAQGPEFLLDLLELGERPQEIFLAIDAPLSWPRPMLEILSGKAPADRVPPEDHQNPYVFRRTERELEAFSPVSAVRNQIGSQAIKAQYFLRKFGFRLAEVGEWKARGNWTAIETFPRVSRRSAKARARLKGLVTAAFPKKMRKALPNVYSDKRDALLCAYAAAAFALRKSELSQPPPDRKDLRQEGWIWRPNDADARLKLRSGEW